MAGRHFNRKDLDVIKITNPIYRQGDVLLASIGKLPTSVTAIAAENGRLILARGEATGHHHSFAVGPQIAMFRDEGAGNGAYLSVTAPTPLEHQEHTALLIEPRDYGVMIQRTYASGMARRVED